jgi:hypothetical protein
MLEVQPVLVYTGHIKIVRECRVTIFTVRFSMYHFLPCVQVILPSAVFSGRSITIHFGSWANDICKTDTEMLLCGNKMSSK